MVSIKRMWIRVVQWARRTNKLGATTFAVALLGMTLEALWPRPARPEGTPLHRGQPILTAPAIEAAPPRLDAHQLRLRVVREQAVRASVPVAIALAVSMTENWGGDTLALSSAGAVGIMQIMPSIWGAEFRAECGDAPLTNPQRNACVGVRILKQYFERYGNWNLALRAYNGSLRYKRSGDEYVAEVMQRLDLGD